MDRYGTTAVSPGAQINNIKQKGTTSARWRRVVFKISGCTLAGTPPQNIDPKVYFQLEYCDTKIKLNDVFF